MRTRDLISQRLERYTPFNPSIGEAMSYLASEGFQFINRSKDEVPDITGYSDFGYVTFGDFVTNARINLRNDIPWINHDPNNFLWFWIQEYERIFTYAPTNFQNIHERITRKRARKKNQPSKRHQEDLSDKPRV